MVLLVEPPVERARLGVELGGKIVNGAVKRIRMRPVTRLMELVARKDKFLKTRTFAALSDEAWA